MMKRTPAPRGVSLIEGMVASVILLTGLIGVLQGIAIASQQNSMANRQTRAAVIAQELVTVLEQQGRARLLSVGGPLAVASCSAATALPTTSQLFVGELSPTPALLSGQGFVGCYVDFDTFAGAAALTPGYSTFDNSIFDRVIAVYSHPTNPEITYVGINVGWRDSGRTRTLKRFTALYDTTTNQSNLEF